MLQGRLATINTYICTMHPEGCDVFVINPRQWEVQEENAKIKRKKVKQKTTYKLRIISKPLMSKIASSFLTLVLKTGFFPP